MTTRLPVPSVGAVRRSVIVAGITALGVAGWLVLQVIHLAHEADARRTELGRAAADRIELRQDVDRITAALDKANNDLIRVGEPAVPVPSPIADPPRTPSMWLVPTKTLAVTGPGKTGPPGKPGLPGPAATGVPGSAGADGKAGGDGLPGSPGSAGANGANGADGFDGVDGRGIASAEIRDCRLILTLTDGTDLDAGPVPCPTATTATPSPSFPATSAPPEPSEESSP